LPVTKPEPVAASFAMLVRTIFQIETSRHYSCNKPPMIRETSNAPVVLREEIGVGSIVRLAIGDDGLLRAVQIMQAVVDDPFAEAA
jgi:hypothetical protein